MSAILQMIRNQFQERQEARAATYADLLARLADDDGDPIGPEAASSILEASGRTIEQLESDLAAERKRRELVELTADFDELQELHQKRAAELAALQEESRTKQAELAASCAQRIEIAHAEVQRAYRELERAADARSELLRGTTQTDAEMELVSKRQSLIMGVKDVSPTANAERREKLAEIDSQLAEFEAERLQQRMEPCGLSTTS